MMLLDLAEETLLHIFSYADLPTLRDLCRVNKTCHRLAYPLMFRSFPGGNLHMFLLAIARKPYLATSVRDVTLDEWQPPEEDPVGDNSESSPIAEEDLTLLRSAALGVELPQLLREQIASDLTSCPGDAEVTLLMALCTQLRALRFRAIPFGVYASRIMDLARFSTQNQCEHGDMASVQHATTRPLSRLQEVYAHHWDTESSTNLADLHPILCVPELDSLSGVMLSYTMGPDEVQVAAYLRLKSITVEQADFEATNVAQLLSSSPVFATLHLDWGSSMVTYANVRWDEIGAVLRQHGMSLEILRLNIEDLLENDEPIFLPLGSLKGLESLACLDVPQVALLGVDDDLDDNYPNFVIPQLTDILPGSLESLKISQANDDDGEDILSQSISRLIADTRYQKLHLVQIHWGGDDELDITLPNDSDWKQSMRMGVIMLNRKL